MDLEQAKKLIDNTQSSRMRRKYTRLGRKARRYYKCDNDIKYKARPKSQTTDVFRVSNHRIASNFFRVIVDQKASYLFGNPPVIDVGDDSANEAINRILGEQWGKNLKRACVLASIWTDAWLQYWINEEGEFKYAIIANPDNITANWGGYSNEELVLLVKQTENWLDPDTGEFWNLYEIWTTERCYFYRYPVEGTLDDLEEEIIYPSGVDTSSFEDKNSFAHEYEEVPFIHLKNNSEMVNDLIGIKEYIDSYDDTMSSLADDITDSQNAIFVLKGYGDQSGPEFWRKVQEDRIINLIDIRDWDDDSDAPVFESDAKLLAIEPPIAASQLNLELTRKAIFEQGGGVDPTPEVLGNTSGEALKHMYNLLELKSKAMEDEFRIGIARLVRAICKHIGYDIPEGQLVKQIWKRTRINNDTELINNAVNSSSLLSRRTIYENHPWVDDPDEEERRVEEEKRESEQRAYERAQEDYILAMQEKMNDDRTDDSQGTPVLGTPVPNAGGGETE